MALFQTTVVQKYLKAQDQTIINEKWKTYKAHFHNPSIQENVRNAKEEQYQEGFLRDLFVNVLGYTLNPETNFNLTTELKNVKDAKKADGGILVNDKVVGVIELKGTDTTDLSKVESQAFGYKNNQKNCTYVITSNFEKLRFYIDNAIEHLAFDLFQLTEKEFKLLYLCLAYENISKDIPKKLKSESLSQEDVITKQLYKDYSLFKRELFNNLTELNPDTDPLLLFKKSQKLLDRFLFLFFAEDRHLLPPNSVRLVLKQWKQLKELDAYSPLYSRYKKYFGYLNTGHKGKKYDVYPYNGGLFKSDDILDNIEIDDDLLYRHTLKLSEYDFDSEVDVNILGHIFENSLNEIEEIQTQLEEDPNAKPKVSKRKKDGVFYTPKYITKYIVENTVGKLCEERKESLAIVEEEYNNKRQKKTKETLLGKLKTYRQWLLQLTIVDPACGSGAFLNEALNYLIAEHQYIDELETKLMGGGFVFPNVENSILENNLFGVDINNESVEIAKLSLWLRTAQPNRKLNDLSHNIKCGNSLIDDPEVAGDKAFNWGTEFPKVFTKGGFDVVIGNPPYGAKVSSNDGIYLSKYNIGKSGNETYAYFYERGLRLLNKNGIIGYITPDTWLRKDDFEDLRLYLLKQFNIEKIIETGPVFKDARDTWCLLIFINNRDYDKTNFIQHLQIDRTVVSIEERQKIFEEFNWSKNEFVKQEYWINTFGSSFGYLCSEKEQRVIKKLLSFSRISDNDEFKISRGEEGSQSKFDKGINSDFFMVKPEQVSKFYTAKGWPTQIELLSPNKLDSLYTLPKIYIIRIQKMRWIQRIVAALDERENSSALKTLQIIVHITKDLNKLRAIEGILNSKLINFWSINFLSDDINSSFLKNIPLLKDLNSEKISETTASLSSITSSFHNLKDFFKRYFQSSLNFSKSSRKLDNWHELDFADFIKELNKAIKKAGGTPLTKKDEFEWLELFEDNKKKAQELQTQITQKEKEIDQMVYELYGLTEEEIEVVESS